MILMYCMLVSVIVNETIMDLPLTWFLRRHLQHRRPS